MSWPKIILLAWYALSVVVTITQIGKERRPLEPSTAAGMVVITGLVAFLVVLA